MAGCPDAEEQFIEGRLLEACDRAWPICTTTAGCVIGDKYYLEGTFPGPRRFVVRTEGLAEIAVLIYVKNEGSPGKQTTIVWNEESCGSQQLETIDGNQLFKEAQAVGYIRRARTVHKSGDHLIEIDSTATAGYLLKVEVGDQAAQ